MKLISINFNTDIIKSKLIGFALENPKIFSAYKLITDNFSLGFKPDIKNKDGGKDGKL